MSRLPFVVLAAAFATATTVLVAENSAIAAWQRHRLRSAETLQALAATTISTPTDDATPTAELAFGRFFGPVGDEGLAYSDYLRGLAGKRIRISGFMVRESQRHAGVFLMVERPSITSAEGSCVAADLPPAVVYVHAPTKGMVATAMPFVPGRLVVNGTLEIGAQREADGRNSWVRVRLDHAPSFIAANGSRWSALSPTRSTSTVPFRLSAGQP